MQPRKKKHNQLHQLPVIQLVNLKYELLGLTNFALLGLAPVNSVQKWEIISNLCHRVSEELFDNVTSVISSTSHFELGSYTWTCYRSDQFSLNLLLQLHKWKKKMVSAKQKLLGNVYESLLYFELCIPCRNNARSFLAKNSVEVKNEIRQIPHLEILLQSGMYTAALLRRMGWNPHHPFLNPCRQCLPLGHIVYVFPRHLESGKRGMRFRQIAECP